MEESDTLESFVVVEVVKEVDDVGSVVEYVLKAEEDVRVPWEGEVVVPM